MDNTQRSARQFFKLTPSKIFLAQLNKIDAAASCLGDLRQQSALTSALVPRKLGTIGDVQEKQAPLRVCFRDFGHAFALFAFMLRFGPQVVLGQAITQKLKTLFR